MRTTEPGVTSAPLIAPSLRALGHPDAADVVTVTLDLADCLGVGYSLKALALSGGMPEETRAKYNSVGDQLVSAARAEMKRRIDLAASSKAGAR